MKRILRILLSLILGLLTHSCIEEYQKHLYILMVRNKIVIAVLVGLAFYFFSSYLFRLLDKLVNSITKMPFKDIVLCASGLFAGFLAACLISVIFRDVIFYSEYISAITGVILGYIGFQICYNKRQEINQDKTVYSSGEKQPTPGKPKVIDTSVIIDGRILDILKTGFIEGKIIIPNFVLEELRHIADSSDSLRRSRGRLGLDILNQIQDLTNVTVEIAEFNGSQELEVDIKLLKLAEQLNAYVVTNDYNLNKVAGIHKVPVLNVNNLSNAVKSVILPGQDLPIFILKEGKEPEQGIGYLNDGTMIVVEEGKKYIGESIEITVTSALQTSAGRMIFAKPKGTV